MKPEQQCPVMADNGQLTLMGESADSSARLGRRTYGCSSHFQSLLDSLLALRQAGILFDVVLLVEGRALHGHRVLLAASCDYFRGMFTGGLREAQQKEIPIHGVSYLGMKKLLDYIYTSKIELDLDCVQDVLMAATLVQLENVIGFCCEFLSSWVDESNILQMHHLADVYGLQQLKAAMHSHILKNLQALSLTDVYRQLPPEEIFRVLSSDELEVKSENEVYEAALHYHYSPEQVENDQVYLKVSQDSLKMLDAVRFCLMDKQVLQKLHSRLEQCPLKETVSAALQYHKQEMWQPALQSPLTQPRSTFDCILGFGGMFRQPSYLDNEHMFQVFHPSWKEWRILKAVNCPRMSNQGIAVLNNFIYLIGGDRNNSGFRAETCCWRYDPRHNTWCSIQPLHYQHADHCVCVVGDHIYAIGGRDYSNELCTVERYDIHTNKWELVSPLTRKVYAHAGAVLDGKIYITCGRRGRAYLQETQCFDPADNQWTACADGPVGRAWHGMAAVNGRLYVIGGSNDEHGYRRDVVKMACFEPSDNSWSLLSPLPAGHGEPGIAVLDSRIYVLGGRSHDRGVRMKYVHVFNTDKDHWESDTPLLECVSGLAACVVCMPPTVMALAGSWEQYLKVSSDDTDFNSSERSSDRYSTDEDF
uniref:kelch-like protein 22 isoform X1 n=2 Tax=Doryrhamphus excisus TaxID=161450 RepID=UPI0025AE083B|nr:kelch-like protein 22 isoform X1 [Doryrhamphus excisus]